MIRFIAPFIGKFGVFILSLVMLFIAYVIFFPKNFTQVLENLKINLLRLKNFIESKKEEFRNNSLNSIQKKSKEEFKIFIPSSIQKEESQVRQAQVTEIEEKPIDFEEPNIKIYHSNFTKNEDEEKYVKMVKIIDSIETDKVLDVDVDKILKRNKKFFTELEAKYFQDSQEDEEVARLKKILQNDIQSPISSKQSDMADIKDDLELKISDETQQNKNELIEDISIQKNDSKQNFDKPIEMESFHEIQEEAIQNDLKLISSFKPKNIKTIMVRELDENKQLLDELEFGESEKPKDYKLPNIDLLDKTQSQSIEIDETEIDEKIQNFLSKLKMFKIDGDVMKFYSGPIVTTFEFRPAPNVKVSRILSLENDLAMELSAKSIRIQAPIPGKNVVGIEIPNSQSQIIYLREILESSLFQDSISPLTLALGKDIVGNPFVTDLKKLPHLLIAGTTGSGKSVGVNAMILSLLFRNSPDNLKLIMIDPKMVEFSMYADIPHLLAPIITDPKKAIAALMNGVAEMERRYKIMSENKTKTIDNYNIKAKKEGLETFPFLVIIIDELADLMMTGGKEAEFPIARIAQMGRAAGLHLVVATQRPSVDVVTGLIKTNLPSRISFRVGSKTDSRVVLDTEGAQSLLGRGDMLFTPPGGSGLIRLHAPWASEDEIEKIVNFIKSQREPKYDKSFLIEEPSLISQSSSFEESEGDMLSEVKRIILQDRKTSISYIQRRLKIGYNKAANLIEELEKQGFLSTPNSNGNREILGS